MYKKISELVYKQIFFGLYKYCIYWLLYIFTKFGSGITSVNILIYGYSTLSRFTVILLLLLHTRYCPSVLLKAGPSGVTTMVHNIEQYMAIYHNIQQDTTTILKLLDYESRHVAKIRGTRKHFVWIWLQTREMYGSKLGPTEFLGSNQEQKNSCSGTGLISRVFRLVPISSGHRNK